MKKPDLQESPALSELHDLIFQVGAAKQPKEALIFGLLDYIEQHHKTGLQLTRDPQTNNIAFQPITPNTQIKQALEILEPILMNPDHKLHDKLQERAAHSPALDCDFVQRMAVHSDNALGIAYIKHSPLLTEETMKSLIMTGQNSHRFALCERKYLSTKIITRLI